MKIRNGFVSNSSSSSFIIAIKQINIPCPHCGSKDPDFLNMIEQSNNYIDDNRVNTKETKETLDYIEENEKTWMDPEEYKKLEDTLSKLYRNNDWVVVNISLSNHDENLRKIMDNMVSSGNAEILYKTEG